jgi:hypothetical protein
MHPEMRAENLRLVTHAEVLTPDHPIWQPYLNGSKETPPGRLLRDALNDAGGQYEFAADLPDKLIVDVRKAAAMSVDPTLAEVARTGKIWISLEHLRDLDPDATRITYGWTLEPAD